MAGVKLDSQFLGGGIVSMTEKAMSCADRDAFQALCSEWPELFRFWERLEAHVSRCWQMEVDGRYVSVLEHAMREGIRSVDRATTLNSRVLIGRFINEVLFVVSAALAGNVAFAGDDDAWSLDGSETLVAFLDRVEGKQVRVLRQAVSRQQRGAVAQALFFRLLPPHLRAVVWVECEQAMGPPGGRFF